MWKKLSVCLLLLALASLAAGGLAYLAYRRTTGRTPTQTGIGAGKGREQDADRRESLSDAVHRELGESLDRAGSGLELAVGESGSLREESSELGEIAHRLAVRNSAIEGSLESLKRRLARTVRTR